MDNDQRSMVSGERSILPYARQWIDEDDIQAVVEVLRSDWLTTGPKVAEFEGVFANFVGAKEAVAVSSGTAALHAAMYAIGIGPGDEVILPPMTFMATANSIVFQGGIPVFADVDPDASLIDPIEVEAKITPRTKAIIAVDYAGHPCDYDALQSIARRHGLFLIADACHSLGAEYKGRRTGVLADLSVFSFHPVKHITTGEGGMITTGDHALGERVRLFRNHGITRNPDRFTVHGSPFADTKEARPPLLSKGNVGQATVSGQWYYEMQELGFNYRMTDIQAALGISQLKKIDMFIEKRREIASYYNRTLKDLEDYITLPPDTAEKHAWHLYVIQLKRGDRDWVFQRLRENGIGVNVHYIPVYLHPYYQGMGYKRGICLEAEQYFARAITLPLYPAMKKSDMERVVEKTWKTFHEGDDG
jgi:perosamine synthetase